MLTARRLAAAACDVLFIAGSAGLAATAATSLVGNSAALVVIVPTVGFVWPILYCAIGDRYRLTIGKRLCGIEVVSASVGGGSLNGRQALARTAFKFVDITLLLAPEIVRIIRNRRADAEVSSQWWHDEQAGTRVRRHRELDLWRFGDERTVRHP